MPPSIKENAFNGPSATYFNDSIHSSSKALSAMVARAFAQTHHVRECQPTADESKLQFKVTRLPLSSVELNKFI